MRICSPQLGLSPQSILGGEIYDRQILKYLAKQGFEIEICLPLFKPYEKQKHWRISYLPIPFVVPPQSYNLLVLPYLIFLYLQKPFEILRIHSPAYIGLAGLVFKKLFPKVHLVTIHHWLGEGGWLERMIDPHLLPASDAIICDSKYSKTKIEQKYKKTKDKVQVIYNGVDETLKPKVKSSQLLRRMGIPQNAQVLLYLGLFIERKNPLFLLQIVKKLLKYYPNIQLIYCGKGPLEKELRTNIQELDLTGHVHIVPAVFGKEKCDLLNLADVFVHPALNEGFSLAVIEAMACGLPVVITRGYSANEAVLHGTNGFLSRTQTDWLQKIGLLLWDKNLRMKIKRANLEKVKNNFQWAIAAKKHASLFQKLVGYGES